MPDFADFFAAQGLAPEGSAAPAAFEDLFAETSTQQSEGGSALESLFSGDDSADSPVSVDQKVAEGKNPSAASSAVIETQEPAKLLSQGTDGASLFGDNIVQGGDAAIQWETSTKESNGDEGFASLKVPAAVAISLLAAAALLGALGVPQTLAAKLLPKTGGTLHSILFKIATAGSLVHLKFKKTLIPFRRDENAIDCYAGSGVWLYNQIAARPYLVSVKTGQVWPVEDWDLCGDFEIEVGEFPGRAVLMAVCEDGTLSFYCRDDVIRNYRIPTQQEVWLWKTTLSS